MIRCSRCSSEIPETSQFCGICGAPVQPAPQPDVGIYKEKECLDNFYRFLKYERLAWKICGIVWIILSALLGFFGIVFCMMSVEEELLAVLGVEYLLLAFIYLPVAIVNLKMISRAEHYMNIVYNDVNAVNERCGNAGMIVLSAIFNTIAMIFIIINFTRTKTNKAEINSAARRQAEFNNNNNFVNYQ